MEEKSQYVNKAYLLLVVLWLVFFFYFSKFSLINIISSIIKRKGMFIFF